MAPEASPWCGPGELPDVGVRQVGRLPRPDVQPQSVETQTITHLRSRVCHKRGEPPRMSSQVRQVGAEECDAGQGRRSFSTEADLDEVGAVSARSLAADETIGFVGRTGTFERRTLQHLSLIHI